MAPQNRWFAASQNTDYIFKALTDGTVTNLTGGKIPKMTPTQAAGLIGSWLIETGRKDLSNLDVVEKGSGRGRGLSQYTGVRRGPYDAAVAKARAAGEDPNSAQWQIKYFAQEYLNRDLIGWTQVFERMPQNLRSAGEYAKYFTGSAAEGKGYFRPGVPHTDRRMQAAEEVLKHYGSVPKVTAPAQQPAPQQQQPNQSPLMGIGDFIKKMLKGKKGAKRSFNMDRLSTTLGSIAANAPKSDIGFAIFASQKGKKAAKSWKKLDNNTRKAYARAGAQLAIRAPTVFGTGGQPYSFPKNDLSIGSGAREYSNPTFEVNRDTGFNPGGVASIGGLPGGQDIAQWEVANSKYFKNQGSRFGQKAFNLSNATIRNINNRSYGGRMDLGGSLGIRNSAAGQAAAAGGAKYGGKAFSSGFNAGAINAAAYGT